MAKETIVICDKCRANSAPVQFPLETGRQLNGAGESEALGKDVDLCIKHANELIRKILNGMSYEAQAVLLDWVEIR